MKGTDLVAIAALLGAIVGFLGWWRETRKDKSQEQRDERQDRRSDLDVVLTAYQELVNDEAEGRNRTKAELAETLKRAIECEEREKGHLKLIENLQVRVAALEGAIRGQ